MLKQIKWEKYHPNIELPVDDEDDDTKDMQTLVNTPFGMFKVNNALSPFKRFNFWLGNTNFTITKDIKRILNQAEGIDALVVLSRYQFIIGIGKMFDEKTVKRFIEKTLCQQIGLTAALSSTYKYWIIYVLPNDNVTYYGDNDINAMTQYIQLYTEAKKISNGKIFKSKTLKEISI